MRAGDREAVLDLLERAFGERELFARYLDGDPNLDLEDTFLAVDQSRPVSCVQLFSRSIRLRRHAVELAGIGSVATHPDYRGHGLASRLVSDAIEEAQRRQCPIGLLFTQQFSLYERLGWRQISQRQFKLRGGDGESPVDADLRRFEASDLEEVRELYANYTDGLSGCTLRDANYWRAQLRFNATPEERFRVAVRGDRLMAYVRTTELDGRRVALEYARTRGAAPYLAALLLEEVPPDRSLHVPIVPDPELGNALKLRGASPEPSEDPMPMWKVLDRERLAELAGLPLRASDAAILDTLVGGPSATFWASDRF